MTDVVRLRNPNAFDLESIESLIERALETNSMVEDVDLAMAELRRALVAGFDSGAIFLANDGQRWCGVALVQLGASAFAPYCSVLHLYNEGPPPVVRALVRTIVDFAVDNGYDTIVGVDRSEKSRGFVRLFGSLIGPAQTTGRGYMFKVTRDE